MKINLLHVAIALGAAWRCLITLQRDVLEFAKRLEDGLEVFLGDAEVYVSNIQAMEGGTVGAGNDAAAALGGPGSTVLLGLGQLGDDGHALQLLAGEIQCLGNRLLVLELDVANTG